MHGDVLDHSDSDQNGLNFRITGNRQTTCFVRRDVSLQHISVSSTQKQLTTAKILMNHQKQQSQGILTSVIYQNVLFLKQVYD